MYRIARAGRKCVCLEVFCVVVLVVVVAVLSHINKKSNGRKNQCVRFKDENIENA